MTTTPCRIGVEFFVSTVLDVFWDGDFENRHGFDTYFGAGISKIDIILTYDDLRGSYVDTGRNETWGNVRQFGKVLKDDVGVPQGHLRVFSPLCDISSVVIVNAAGGILSSPLDMIKYMQFHLNLGKVGDQQIVPENVMSWLTTPSNMQFRGVIKTGDNPNATVDLNVAYSLCLNVGIYDGWLRLSHGGYITPYESSMHIFPTLNLGIFIVMNGPGSVSGTLYPLNILVNDIFDTLQGNAKRSSHIAPVGQPSDLTVGPYPVRRRYANDNQVNVGAELKIEPEEAVGLFGSGFNGEMNITMRTNLDGVPQLYVEYGIWGHGWLTQSSNATFTIAWDTDYWMMSWSNQVGATEVTLYFVDVDTIQYLEAGFQSATNFERGLRLDDLPEIPYAPDSCGL
ncbi:hypothetical protein Fcan01_24476 [Folsomia candida]|uniref:Uncharacterized protein n=1 Tax=Folsomia candida TaxID=158441 RepID=A0A226D5C3_FOLCA|nr:hypothetical protein Fcan01_24476 [Folsomia candida]